MPSTILALSPMDDQLSSIESGNDDKDCWSWSIDVWKASLIRKEPCLLAYQKAVSLKPRIPIPKPPDHIHNATSVSHTCTCMKSVVGSQYLEHFVGRWFNSRWHVWWLKHKLLHLSKVVLRVTIQDHLTDGHQRIVTMGPDLSVMEKRETW